MHYYNISLLRSSAPILTYAFKEKLTVGTLVSIPLKTTVKEAVIREEVSKPSFETAKIISVSDKKYRSEQMDIAKFISEYYFSSFSEAISLFLPYAIDAHKNRRSGSPHPDENLKTNIYDVQHEDVGVRVPRPTLSLSQQKAYEQLLTKDKALLFGVTGSGKTEIFISLMVKMMEEGKTSIFLMPEISLTPQMEKRLKVYFGDAVAMWHSKLTKKRKNTILEDIASGKIRIVAGARSALFVPLSNLGLIIVDEEYDDSYKAMTRPRYHARDVVVLMGKCAK